MEDSSNFKTVSNTSMTEISKNKGTSTAKFSSDDDLSVDMLPDSHMTIEGFISDKKDTFLLDMGSGVNCLHIDTFKDLIPQPELRNPAVRVITTVDGRKTPWETGVRFIYLKDVRATIPPKAKIG